MPWDVRRSKSGWEVVNPETGRVVGHHPTRRSAEEQQRALYVNVPESRKSMEPTHDFSSDVPEGRDSAYDVASIAYSTPPGITNVDTINRLKQIINGSNSNRRKKKAEDGEMPVQDTWQGQFFPRRY